MSCVWQLLNKRIYDDDDDYPTLTLTWTVNPNSLTPNTNSVRINPIINPTTNSEFPTSIPTNLKRVSK